MKQIFLYEIKNRKLVINLILQDIILKVILFLTNLTNHVSIVLIKEPDETGMTDWMRTWEIIPFRRLMAVDAQLILFFLNLWDYLYSCFFIGGMGLWFLWW